MKLQNGIVFFMMVFLSTRVFAMQDIVRDKDSILQDRKERLVSDKEYDTKNYVSPNTQFVTHQLKKEGRAQKTQKFQVPFTMNVGQVDERVKFYVNTFMGTVFITGNGEIVYSLFKPEKGWL